MCACATRCTPDDVLVVVQLLQEHDLPERPLQHKGHDEAPVSNRRAWGRPGQSAAASNCSKPAPDSHDPRRHTTHIGKYRSTMPPHLRIGGILESVKNFLECHRVLGLLINSFPDDAIGLQPQFAACQPPGGSPVPSNCGPRTALRCPLSQHTCRGQALFKQTTSTRCAKPRQRTPITAGLWQRRVRAPQRPTASGWATTGGHHVKTHPFAQPLLHLILLQHVLVDFLRHCAVRVPG